MSAGNDTAVLKITAYDGTRSPLTSSKPMLVTIFNTSANRTFTYQNSFKTTSAEIEVPFEDGPGDYYAVTAWIDGFVSAGFPTVHAMGGAEHDVDVMLIPDPGRFHFFHADLDSLRLENELMADLLSADTSPTAADDRYVELTDSNTDQAALACFFNLTTAMQQIPLSSDKTVLDYMRQVIWNDPANAKFAQDRFFGFADSKLIDEVKAAAGQHLFAQEFHPEIFHPDATLSYKQTQFGEANVQLTFHQKFPPPHPDWVKIEPDIDYYKDPGAHGLLEVLHNKLTQGLTDPREVYVLRWIAGRQAGTPDFNPPYEIV